MIKYKLFSVAIFLCIPLSNGLIGMDNFFDSGDLQGNSYGCKKLLYEEKRPSKITVDSADKDSIKKEHDDDSLTTSESLTTGFSPLLSMQMDCPKLELLVLDNALGADASEGIEAAAKDQVSKDEGDDLGEASIQELDLAAAWPIALEIFLETFKVRAFSLHKAHISPACSACSAYCFAMQEQSSFAGVGIDVASLLCQLNIKFFVLLSTSNDLAFNEKYQEESLFKGLSNELLLLDLFRETINEIIDLFAWKSVMQASDDDPVVPSVRIKQHFYNRVIYDLAVGLFNDGQDFDTIHEDRAVFMVCARAFYAVHVNCKIMKMSLILGGLERKIESLRYGWDVEMCYRDQQFLTSIDSTGSLVRLCKDVAFNRVHAKKIRSTINA